MNQTFYAEARPVWPKILLGFLVGGLLVAGCYQFVLSKSAPPPPPVVAQKSPALAQSKSVSLPAFFGNLSLSLSVPANWNVAENGTQTNQGQLDLANPALVASSDPINTTEYGNTDSGFVVYAIHDAVADKLIAEDKARFVDQTLTVSSVSVGNLSAQRVDLPSEGLHRRWYITIPDSLLQNSGDQTPHTLVIDRTISQIGQEDATDHLIEQSFKLNNQ